VGGCLLLVSVVGLRGNMQSKVCPKCGCEKGFDCFSKDKSTKNGITCYCKDCLGASRKSKKPFGKGYNKTYYLNNRDKVLDSNKRYREKNSDVLKQKKSQYYLNNKEAINQKNRENYYKNLDSRKESNRSWKQRNKSSVLLSATLRKKKIRAATPPWLSEDQKSQIRDLYWLAQDLRSVTGEEYHVDHIVPVRNEVVCGLNVPWNLQILPSDINLSKSNSFDAQEEGLNHAH